MPRRPARALDENQGGDDRSGGQREAQVPPRQALGIRKPSRDLEAGKPSPAGKPGKPSRAGEAGKPSQRGRLLGDDPVVMHDVALEALAAPVADHPPHGPRGKRPGKPHARGGAAGLVPGPNEPYGLPGERHREAAVVSALHGQ
jgi:hypothetical protein